MPVLWRITHTGGGVFKDGDVDRMTETFIKADISSHDDGTIGRTSSAGPH